MLLVCVEYHGALFGDDAANDLASSVVAQNISRISVRLRRLPWRKYNSAADSFRNTFSFYH